MEEWEWEWETAEVKSAVPADCRKIRCRSYMHGVSSAPQFPSSGATSSEAARKKVKREEPRGSKVLTAIRTQNKTIDDTSR